MRIRVRKILFWGFVFVLAVMGGALGFAYSYITDSDTLAGLIRGEVPKYLPGSLFKVDRVLLRPLVGEVELKQITVHQQIDGASFPAVRIPWLQARTNLQGVWRGDFTPREVVVVQPTLRITKRKDGSWNWQGLLADPWPLPDFPVRPVVVINKGVVELVEGDSRATILHDVLIRIEPTATSAFTFSGSAEGDAFERLELEGSFDPETGSVEFTKGALTGLTLSDAVRHRVPREFRPIAEQIGLTGGEVDLAIKSFSRDPLKNPSVRYELDLGLRSGVWNCPQLPFPLSNVTASATLKDGALAIHRAEGFNGKTIVRASGSLSAREPATGPLDLNVEVLDLELDERLKRWTPPELARVWTDFSPPDVSNLGRVNVALRTVRPKSGAALGWGMTVDCRDVTMRYFQFPYLLEHIRGTLTWQGPRILVDVSTVVGGKPLTGKGTIQNPGPDAIVDLSFEAGAMPIDDALIRALPPDARQVVSEFHPTGSVRGTAQLHREPTPDGDPRGLVRVDSALDLNDECSMRWDGLPYAVRKLTGHLELHPDHWIFTGMRGENGLAQIEANGRVDQKRPGDFAVDVRLKARHLPFDSQLRAALPSEWQATWEVLNPTGASKVDAHIVHRPDQQDDYEFLIEPEEETRVRLKLTPAPQTAVAGNGGVILLPVMEDVSGKFLYQNGTVTMRDVAFVFREAPVRFAGGTVIVRDDRRFDLHVIELDVSKLRLDAELRQIMPPLMAQFARRLDDGKSFSARGNLGIAWSGEANEPAVCTWDHVRVILNDNAVRTGLPLEHLQGELSNVSGRSDGRSFQVKGAIDLDSVVVRGQQITRLSSPLVVGEGKAVLSDIKGTLLGGEITGAAEISLDATPRYQARLRLREADLQRYTRTVSGKQEIRGRIFGQVELSGLGGDVRSIQGEGEAHIAQGDLGKLPIALQLFKAIRLSPVTKTAFDTADVEFTIQNGEAVLNPIKFTGDAFSLRGAGTIDPMGELDLRLKVLYGRDERLHIPVISDLTREASGQFMTVHVHGPAATPKFDAIVLPAASEIFNRFGEKRALNADRDKR